MTSYLGHRLDVSRRTIERAIALLLTNKLIYEVKKDGRIRRFAPTDFAISTKSKWDIGKEGIIKRKCYLRVPSDDKNTEFSVGKSVVKNVAESKGLYIHRVKWAKSSSISPSSESEKKEEDFPTEHERLKQKYGDEAWDRAMNYIASGNQVFNLEKLLKSNKRHFDLIKALPNQKQKTIERIEITKTQHENIKTNAYKITEFLNGYSGLPCRMNASAYEIQIGNDTLYLHEDTKYIERTLESLKTDRRILRRSYPTEYFTEPLYNQMCKNVVVV